MTAFSPNENVSLKDSRKYKKILSNINTELLYVWFVYAHRDQLTGRKSTMNKIGKLLKANPDIMLFYTYHRYVISTIINYLAALILVSFYIFMYIMLCTYRIK